MRFPGTALGALALTGGLQLKPVVAEKPADPAAKPQEQVVVQTPSEGLKAIKAATGKRYGYRPHTGAKQKAKAERARIKALKKAAGL